MLRHSLGLHCRVTTQWVHALPCASSLARAFAVGKLWWLLQQHHELVCQCLRAVVSKEKPKAKLNSMFTPILNFRGYTVFFGHCISALCDFTAFNVLFNSQFVKLPVKSWPFAFTEEDKAVFMCRIPIFKYTQWRKLFTIRKALAGMGAGCFWGFYWERKTVNVFFIVYRLQVQMSIMETLGKKQTEKDQNGLEWGETAVKLVYVA